MIATVDVITEYISNRTCENDKRQDYMMRTS